MLAVGAIDARELEWRADLLQQHVRRKARVAGVVVEADHAFASRRGQYAPLEPANRTPALCAVVNAARPGTRSLSSISLPRASPLDAVLAAPDPRRGEGRRTRTSP